MQESKLYGSRDWMQEKRRVWMYERKVYMHESKVQMRESKVQMRESKVQMHKSKALNLWGEVTRVINQNQKQEIYLIDQIRLDSIRLD